MRNRSRSAIRSTMRLRDTDVGLSRERTVPELYELLVLCGANEVNVEVLSERIFTGNLCETRWK